MMIVIDLVSFGDDFVLKLYEIGCWLMVFVKDVNLLFEFVGLVGNWELFIVRDMNLRDDDVFLVYSVGLYCFFDVLVVVLSFCEVVLRRI